MSISVLLVDDHMIVREGLRLVLEQEPDFVVVAEAENGRVAVQKAREFKPDVVVMDLTMPEMNGITATSHIIRNVEGVRVLALSMNSDKRFITEALNAGANGFVLKECASEVLVSAIRTVASGGVYLSPTITGVIVDDFVRTRREPRAGSKNLRSTLSARESEVLQLFAEGKSTKEIGFILDLSIKTVDAHRQHIMSKLHLASIADLVKYAIREGLTTID